MRKRFLSMVMALAVVLSLIPAALAGNVCDSVSGDPYTTVTFTVTTGNNRVFGKKITFKQAKGEILSDWENSGGEKRIYKAYMCYDITYTDSQGNSASTTWTDGSIPIKLNSNETYTVTVTPWDITYLRQKYLFQGSFDSWNIAATWTVKGGGNVSLCT